MKEEEKEKVSKIGEIKRKIRKEMMENIDRK